MPDTVLVFTCYLNFIFHTPLLEGLSITPFYKPGTCRLERLKIMPRVMQLGKGAVENQDSRSIWSVAWTLSLHLWSLHNYSLDAGKKKKPARLISSFLTYCFLLLIPTGQFQRLRGKGREKKEKIAFLFRYGMKEKAFAENPEGHSILLQLN